LSTLLRHLKYLLVTAHLLRILSWLLTVHVAIEPRHLRIGLVVAVVSHRICLFHRGLTVISSDDLLKRAITILKTESWHFLEVDAVLDS
jgi:hypothetical protein